MSEQLLFFHSCAFAKKPMEIDNGDGDTLILITKLRCPVAIPSQYATSVPTGVKPSFEFLLRCSNSKDDVVIKSYLNSLCMRIKFKTF